MNDMHVQNDNLKVTRRKQLQKPKKIYIWNLNSPK